MRKFCIILSIMFGLLIAITPLTPGSHEVWLDRAVGDSVFSKEFTTKDVGARGKVFGTVKMTGHTDSCEVNLYIEYANYIKAGAFQWCAREKFDSLTAPGLSGKYYPLKGFGYCRFVVVPWGNYSRTKTKIDLVLEVK